ncbi:MAG: hypothetical protein R3298_11230 [Gammaproteobacteria bacterium]|nr:hypothetical protein [Gammaproteobacteria bacterium]
MHREIVRGAGSLRSVYTHLTHTPRATPAVDVMTRSPLLLASLALLLASASLLAAKPDRTQPAAGPAPEVYSVKVDYTGSMVLVEGLNLDPSTASATLAGVPLVPDPGSTGTLLQFPFTPELGATVTTVGNYVLVLSTDGGSFTASLFIPFALVSAPEPPPPGPDCPCSTEWDQKSNAFSPDGFKNQTPYCVQDNANFVTVQFYDIAVNNYWVLWTGWSGSGGYCELYIDGPHRTLTSQDQFDACAAYLRNIVEVWGNQGNVCLF